MPFLDEFKCNDYYEKYHIKHFNSLFQAILNCSKCGRTFEKKYNYGLHLEQHKSFKCEECNEVIYTKILFNKHLELTGHVQNLNFEQYMKTKNDQNLESIKDIQVLKFKCNKCDKVLNKK